MVDADMVKIGQECQVKWGGNEVFTATVIAMGEEELLSGMEERESQPPPKKTQQSILQLARRIQGRVHQ